MRTLPLLLPIVLVSTVLATPVTVSVGSLTDRAKARVSEPARVSLGDAAQLDSRLMLGAPDLPNYVRAMQQMPQAAKPMAELVYAVLYQGALSTETKAAMGLRIAQVNDSPYVAAHMLRLLRASARGRTAIEALSAPATASATAVPPAALAKLSPSDQCAIAYGDSLTRDVHGVSPDAFEHTRALFNDSEIVELTITTAFFNFFTRYTEALHLPVETWALDGVGPTPSPGTARDARPRVALLSDEEITAAGTTLAAAKDPKGQPGGLGIGMANSQRAMLRAPALGLAWRSYGAAVREKETVGRDIKLQVSFAVSWQNKCRYCTFHQVVGLRRLGVDIAKLVAMQKDDAALTPREAVAVTFARTLTLKPGGVTDADYGRLKAEFGDLGAFEVLLQGCQFAFMNRFTDGLMLPSEDEAVRIYQETYGGGWKGTR